MSRRRVRTSTIVYDFIQDAYFWTQESGDWPFMPSWHARGLDDQRWTRVPSGPTARVA